MLIMGIITQNLNENSQKTEVAGQVTSSFLSVSPHIKGPESTAKIMWAVNLALAPSAIMGVFYFGIHGVITVLLCIGAAIGFEYLYQIFLKKKITITDGSAFLTGLLLAMNLPPSVPFYIPLLGAFVSIILTKQLFGGLGFNLFNPALLGRAFLLISFPKILTTWDLPGSAFFTMDAKTGATPLAILKLEGYDQLINAFGDKISMYSSLLIGNRGGCLGETSIIALIVGALFLLLTKRITWHTPVAYLGTAALIAWIFGGSGSLFSGDPLVHVLSGGLILGAFFMATDYVTTPMTSKGKLIFGLGCGIITMLIRLKGGFPEGVMFSILIMNCFSPLIDRATQPKVFGYIKRKAS
jgi:electron transport complex protein RnfD